jgi:putative ABC transport system permease protein
MNTLFRNFSHTFRRFFTASVLNLLGLSIAFAACFVILTQVDYDYNYNKAYPAHDRIYRVEVDAGGDYGWQIWLARPFCELVGASSPHIQAISVTSLSNSLNDFEVDEHIYSEPWFTGFGDYLEVFQPTMVCGTTASLNEPGHALISASMARRFFGTTDAIGKTIYVDRKSRNQPLVVGGVYQDMPENSQLGNCVFSSYSPNLNKDSWRNWNYALYIRLDSPASLTDVERSVIESCKLNIPRDLISGEGEEDWENFIHFTPLDEVHYSTVGNKAATSKAAVYLLLCVSVLILLTAAVNYMNFSLAETPMRLRSINTQKVLGASTFSLRMYLLLESVLVCVCGFLFRISRQQRIAKETEEIIFHTIYFEAGFPVFYYRITPRVTSFSIHSAPVGHFRITVGQPFTHQVIAGAIFLVRQHINMLDVLYIAAHSELPHHHIGNEQHKHQRDAQSCHVDQCKQLVAVKIGKISFQSFHRIL